MFWVIVGQHGDINKEVHFCLPCRQWQSVQQQAKARYVHKDSTPVMLPNLQWIVGLQLPGKCPRLLINNTIFHLCRPTEPRNIPFVKIRGHTSVVENITPRSSDRFVRIVVSLE